VTRIAQERHSQINFAKSYPTNLAISLQFSCEAATR
jgi:hypothetical protein